MNETERIIALSDAFGPSGFEEEVTELVRSELDGFDNIEVDSMRNLRVVLNPGTKGPKVMLDAHLDEVGVIVQAVRPQGTMKFLPVGGQSATNFPNSSYRLRNRDGRIVPIAFSPGSYNN